MTSCYYRYLAFQHFALAKKIKLSKATSPGHFPASITWQCLIMFIIQPRYTQIRLISKFTACNAHKSNGLDLIPPGPLAVHHYRFTALTPHLHRFTTTVSPSQFTITIHHYGFTIWSTLLPQFDKLIRFSTLSPLNIETSGLQFSEYFRATALCSICFDSSHRSYLDLTTQSTCFLRLTDLFGP